MDAELDRHRLRTHRRIADGLQIGGTVLNVDAREKAALRQRVRGNPQQLHGRRARLFHMAVGVVPEDQIVDNLQERAVLRVAGLKSQTVFFVAARHGEHQRAGMGDCEQRENEDCEAGRPDLETGIEAAEIENRNERQSRSRDDGRSRRRALRAGKE